MLSHCRGRKTLKSLTLASSPAQIQGNQGVINLAFVRDENVIFGPPGVGMTYLAGRPLDAFPSVRYDGYITLAWYISHSRLKKAVQQGKSLSAGWRVYTRPDILIIDERGICS